ncbi:MAG TPA: hypothetical protein VLA14_00950 [Polyangia bacterium]|jgi:hypothetical protein|nr:hypothetical protein [Polyangia bacterium]
MRRPSVVAAALIAISCGAAQANEEWGARPSGGQAADAETAARPTTPPPEVTHTRFGAPPPPPRRPDLPLDRQTAIYIVQGFGTPVGIFGLEAVHRFGSYFELAGGVGVGESADGSTPKTPISRSWQWSLMPRVRIGRTDYDSFTAGLGASGGQYGGLNFCVGCDDEGSSGAYPTAYTLWTNFEIGGEHWTHGGFAVRYFVGLARGTPVGAGSADLSPLSFPYTGVGIGYAF